VPCRDFESPASFQRRLYGSTNLRQPAVRVHIGSLLIRLAVQLSHGSRANRERQQSTRLGLRLGGRPATPAGLNRNRWPASIGMPGRHHRNPHRILLVEVRADNARYRAPCAPDTIRRYGWSHGGVAQWPHQKAVVQQSPNRRFYDLILTGALDTQLIASVVNMLHIYGVASSGEGALAS
jgi:hypothetical protein